ncbi:mycofactocin biosynthesis peptidyl-dipeptidase MftE [Lacisediminihabitans changchengi]|uniref:Mycofactocin biosynthesis peptidyl-dipeptidase MftE n=1 Tax=Lacisediminihabitans changchengi TaxID=2787634 RepID=A0A934SNC6_9MICO|nr:mycofactocin biosynthesis peptidyl-dipeptidase MftE [Lacisediminihabitans changchengi]MBK4348565.1 mycofactocin biosynthesis peptidyl-dipeptidase MftE [Lacisediminihabitans changchengi]
MIHELATGAWPGFEGAPLLLVPLGSTEQHGPHLPFDTDAVIATAVARGLVERLAGDAVIAPTLNYGSSGEHQGFPGTASIGQEALRSLLIELVRSVDAWAGSVIFVNGHGGNIRPLSTAVTELIAEQHSVAWLPCAVRGGDAHAGRTETSLMLHLAPQTVRLEHAEPGNTAPLSELTDLATGGLIAVTANGILGDPTGATAAEGAELLEAMIAGAARRVAACSLDARGCLRDAE